MGLEQIAPQEFADVSWSAEQLGILRELGHEPMLLATTFGGTGSVGAASAANESPQRAGEVAAEAAPTDSRLAAAIARAAGGDLPGLALDLERLRREPALKRALWPQLRALRRGR